MQARFWINLGADNAVRVKLNPGQSIEWSRNGRTEEGWSAEGETYRLEGDTVVREWWTDGADCDGRLSDAGEAICRVDALDAYSYQWEGKWHSAPLWTVVDRYYRDYQAEAAGY